MNPLAPKAYNTKLREKTHLFLNLLEKEGYLTYAKRWKHILTRSGISKVLNTFWDVPMRPVKRLSMGIIITLELITGLQPGKMLRNKGVEVATISADC